MVPHPEERRETRAHGTIATGTPHPTPPAHCTTHMTRIYSTMHPAPHRLHSLNPRLPGRYPWRAAAHEAAAPWGTPGRPQPHADPPAEVARAVYAVKCVAAAAPYPPHHGHGHSLSTKTHRDPSALRAVSVAYHDSWAGRSESAAHTLPGLIRVPPPPVRVGCLPPHGRPQPPRGQGLRHKHRTCLQAGAPRHHLLLHEMAAAQQTPPRPPHPRPTKTDRRSPSDCRYQRRPRRHRRRYGLHHVAARRRRDPPPAGAAAVTVAAALAAPRAT